jgi:lipoprotein NlpI
MGKGNIARADSDLTRAIDLRPGFFLTYSMRGSLRYKAGNFDGAIADFDKEIALKPNHVMGYVNRAVARGEKKEFRAALDDIEQALIIDPTWSQAFIYRGIYYNQLNLKDSACFSFKLAKILKNPQADAYMKQYCH